MLAGTVTSTSKKWQLFACLVPLVLGLDQATKLYVHTTFALHESRPVIDNLFAFTYVRNSGAAFGMLALRSTSAFTRHMTTLLASRRPGL